MFCMDKVASFFFNKSILLIPKKPFFWVLYYYESYGGLHFSTILYNNLRNFFLQFCACLSRICVYCHISVAQFKCYFKSIPFYLFIYFFVSKELCEFYSYNSSFLGNYKIQSIIMCAINLLFLKLVRIY